MSKHKIEIRKRYVNPKPKQWWKVLFWTPSCGLTPKVDGFDYFVDGGQVAASHWDGQKMVIAVSEGWEGLFGGSR